MYEDSSTSVDLCSRASDKFRQFLPDFLSTSGGMRRGLGGVGGGFINVFVLSDIDHTCNFLVPFILESKRALNCNCYLFVTVYFIYNSHT